MDEPERHADANIRPAETREPAQDLTDSQRDAEAAAEREAWLTTRLQKEREFVLSVVGKALGEVVGQAHKDARLELSEEVRKLRIELSNLETTLAELRQIVASERAKVVDMPSPLQRRIN
jgi:hypothetical protein